MRNGGPKAIHRLAVERVLTPDVLTQRENVIVVAPHGLGKTMIARISSTRRFWPATRRDVSRRRI
jgi:hypothetical protein